MDFSLNGILALVRFSVSNPRAAARLLIALRLPNSVRWLLFALVATLSTLLTHIGFNMLPTDETSFMAEAMANPLRTALVQAGFLLIAVLVTYRVGLWRGGVGTFADAMLLISWLQVVLLCLQVIQLGLLLILPPLAEVLGLFGLVLTFWLLTHFIMELHGFTSAWAVFWGILATLLVAVVAIAIVILLTVGVGV